MKWLFFLFPFLIFSADYDCIVIGSSPISLFEALYQHSSGKKVLVLEGSCCVGGAWQTIDVCGVQHADVGCHLIGSNKDLANFLEVYAGCSIVPLDTPDDPKAPYGKNGFYFAHGCYELLDQLQKMVANTSIDFRLDHEVLSAEVDRANEQVVLKTKNQDFSGKKIFLTSYIYFKEDSDRPAAKKVKYHHLYLLVRDPTPPRFSYSHGIARTARMMNITPFVDLENTGLQLLIFQTHDEGALQQGPSFLELLKEKQLIDPSAHIVDSGTYTYEQWPSNKISLSKQYPTYFEQLDTHTIIAMVKHIQRWKSAMKPYDLY